MTTPDAVVYGVRGPDPRNTVVKAEDRAHAAEMAEDFPGDVVVVSRDGGQTWKEATDAPR